MGLLRKINKIIFINFGGRKEKTTFLFVFLTYFPGFLLKFRSRELVVCGTKFSIQRVPTRHTFNGPRYLKNKKYLKKRDDDIMIMFFSGISFLGVVRSIKSMLSGYSLDAEFNSTSNQISRLKFE